MYMFCWMYICVCVVVLFFIYHSFHPFYWKGRKIDNDTTANNNNNNNIGTVDGFTLLPPIWRKINFPSFGWIFYFISIRCTVYVVVTSVYLDTHTECIRFGEYSVFLLSFFFIRNREYSAFFLFLHINNRYKWWISTMYILFRCFAIEPNKWFLLRTRCEL